MKAKPAPSPPSDTGALQVLQVPLRRSFVFRIVTIHTGMLVVLLAAGIWHNYTLQKREVVNKFGIALEAIAATAAPFVDARDLTRIQTNEDTSGQAFQKVRGILEQIRNENNLQEDQIYILRQTPDEVGHYHFVVMLQPQTFVGDPYRPPTSIEQLYGWVLGRRDALRTPLYTDDHGTFISGMAPIVGPDGQAVAILQVDYSLDKYMNEVQGHTRNAIFAGGIVVLLGLLFGLWMYHYVSRRTMALLQGTQAIHKEDYSHKIPALGEDELGSVALALNQALSQLKERFEMLKFLPRHTTRMIQKASHQDGGGVHLDTGHRVRAVVLESDIRGFSSISENMSPEEVIGMLNKYIRIQAELVSQAGGSIDKYMGDAVLAIFEGEDMERQALECAVLIQEAVTRMNAQGVFKVPIHIGVGLSVGELVMGNMGSEDRMEYTIIGATVNLAARLCSAAEGGQIVALSELADLARTQGLELPPGDEEQLRVKGFEEPVACHRLRPVVETEAMVE